MDVFQISINVHFGTLY